jgi:hypothetical protein
MLEDRLQTADSKQRNRCRRYRVQNVYRVHVVTLPQGGYPRAGSMIKSGP